jgi:hypothetical protein
MHFAAAAQVLLRYRVQGSEVRVQLECGTDRSINSSKTTKTLYCIRNQESERISKDSGAGKKLTPEP